MESDPVKLHMIETSHISKNNRNCSLSFRSSSTLPLLSCCLQKILKEGPCCSCLRGTDHQLIVV